MYRSTKVNGPSHASIMLFPKYSVSTNVLNPAFMQYSSSPVIRKAQNPCKSHHLVFCWQREPFCLMADAMTFYSEVGGVERCDNMAKVRGLVLVGGDTVPEQKKLNCGNERTDHCGQPLAFVVAASTAVALCSTGQPRAKRRRVSLAHDFFPTSPTELLVPQPYL